MIELTVEQAYYETDKPVISNFTISVKHGEVVAIVGQSGIGKSTLLKIIAGLHTNYVGKLSIDSGLRVAYIPQNQSLLPWKTVYENVVSLAKTENKTIDRAKALDVITKLGLSDFEKQFPLKLSGGQYKRVALGQAFFYEPDLILMDEPFSGLDSTTKKGVQDLFMKLQGEKAITTIFVTHDLTETEYLGSRIIEFGEA